MGFIHLTDGLQFVEIHIIDWSKVTWQLVQGPSWLYVPNINETIGWSWRYQTAIWWPGAFEKIFLKVMCVSSQHSCAPFLWSVGPHIPNSQSIVHRVRQYKCPVWRQRHSSHGVGVTGHCVLNKIKNFILLPRNDWICISNIVRNYLDLPKQWWIFWYPKLSPNYLCQHWSVIKVLLVTQEYNKSKGKKVSRGNL